MKTPVTVYLGGLWLFLSGLFGAFNLVMFFSTPIKIAFQTINPIDFAVNSPLVGLSMFFLAISSLLFLITGILFFMKKKISLRTLYATCIIGSIQSILLFQLVGFSIIINIALLGVYAFVFGNYIKTKKVDNVLLFQ